MQNMSDNELDKLFKEAAEGFKPPQDASAWEQMASMLDNSPAATAGFWNWKTISGVTVTGIIAVTALWFAATTNQDKISKTNEKNGANNATQSVVQEQKEQTHAAGTENLASAQPVEDKSSGTNAVARTHINPRISKSVIQKRSSSKVNNSSEGGDGTVSFNDQTQKESEESTPVVAITEQETAKQTHAESSAEAASPSISKTRAAEEKVLINTDSVNATAEEHKVEPVAEDSKTDQEEKEKSKSGSRISIKAAFSPDFSSVNYFSAGKTGTNYGFLIGYAFNNRWSVYTGVISSRKLYDTKEVEGSYNWNDHDYPMKELDGDCRILDIPINVYYTFFPEKSFSLRAGLGFSSYIMRKEMYVYCVDNYGQNAYYEQNVKGENNEWFKVMNLSVAVSKRLSNRFSAEFEPFVKAPLTGVGEGKVSLVSMGAFINLKYDFIILK